ncbi:MAG: helix-hairpin-helix domain-containing protein [Bacteroidia bacterium]
MVISNDYIADQFSLLAKLMDIHGENSFKTKSYSIAAFTIEKLPEQLAEIPQEKIFSIKGIGDAIGKKIIDILQTGELKLLNDFIQKTPTGVLEMLRIKGLGPKKIAIIWKEMEIESVGELLYACQENRLLLYKGFGEKTQKSIGETIEFFLKNQGSNLYAELENYTLEMDALLKKSFPGKNFELTGEFRRQLEIINQLEWVTDADMIALKEFFEKMNFTVSLDEGDKMLVQGPEKLSLCFHPGTGAYFPRILFETSCSDEFLQNWEKEIHGSEGKTYNTESEYFSGNGLQYIPAWLRDKGSIIEVARRNALPNVIQPEDIKAIVHSHSNWSDGSNTIEEMARACIQKGYEWMVISDHSKSAFYANGLNEERIREQHAYVNELNKKLAPFRIFKSIECDILNDGNLDYTKPILSTFDLVITSVHSNLKMTEEKAMMRLLKAIENPYTIILGHMTGRLLLSRPGYPVDHKKVIDACAAHHVVIELNAHPRRLDIDWRWIDYALEKGVLISIDPDAHTIEGFQDTKYGTLVAQKAGLTKEKNLSSFSLSEMESWLANIREIKGIA